VWGHFIAELMFFLLEYIIWVSQRDCLWPLRVGWILISHLAHYFSYSKDWTNKILKETQSISFMSLLFTPEHDYEDIGIAYLLVLG
jgi:hypothetical protein